MIQRFQHAANSICASASSTLLTPYAALAGGRAVLVHCQQGVSRSVTLLLYFLTDRSLKRALLHIMWVRSSEPNAAYTHPNVGFLGQLQLAEARAAGRGWQRLALLPMQRWTLAPPWRRGNTCGTFRPLWACVRLARPACPMAALLCWSRGRPPCSLQRARQVCELVLGCPVGGALVVYAPHKDKHAL